MLVHCKSPRARALTRDQGLLFSLDKLALTAFISALALGGGEARAQDCMLKIEGMPPSVRLDYDPFLPATAPSRMQFRLSNPGAQSCQADLVLVDASRQAMTRFDVGATGLGIELRPISGVSRSVTPSVFTTRMEGGETTDILFDVAILDDAVVPAGQYSERLMLELRQPGTGVAYEQAPVVLDLTSLPRAQMNLSGSRGDFGVGASVSVVDFGKAETGKVRQLYVQTRANNPARLTFKSANDGKLKIVGEGTASLDYSVRFDGSVLDLKQVAVRDIDPPRTYAGQAFELLLTLGKVEGAQSGNYNDELTIEISTL